MDKSSLKDSIKEVSVRLFSEKGFHATTIREIAKESECSLPMLYYYYKSKEELFYEVAYREYVSLTGRLFETLDTNGMIQDVCFDAIRQRKELSVYDKAAFKLSMKTWLGLNGNLEVSKALNDYVEEQMKKIKVFITGYYGNTEEGRTRCGIILRVIENMIEKIILFDEDIPEEVIKRELEVCMGFCDKKE